MRSLKLLVTTACLGLLAATQASAAGKPIEPTPLSSFGSVSSAVPGTGQSALVAGDFNGDTVTDFASLASTGAVTLSLSAGSFVGVSPTVGPTLHVHADGGAATDANPRADRLETADFDRNGALDLVAILRNEGLVVLALGNGQGSFGAPTAFKVRPTAPGAQPAVTDLAVGDLDADGKLDVAVTEDAAPTRLDILFGDGAGTLMTDPTRQVAVPTGGGVQGLGGVELSDLDDDGALDLIVTTRLSNSTSIMVLRGTGGGQFTPQFAVPAGLGIENFKVGDVNGDGKPDLVLPGEDTTVRLGLGTGAFGAATALDVDATTTDVEVGDLNLDGFIDVAGFDGNRTAAIRLALGRGDGTFGTVKTSAPNGKYVDLISGDFNADGRTDLAALESGAVVMFRNADARPIDNSGKALISEFRDAGAGGTGDEYVQLYNRSWTKPLPVGGWILRSSAGDTPRRAEARIPEGVVIPPGGHLLFAAPSALGYSLSAFGATALQLPNGLLGVTIPGGIDGLTQPGGVQLLDSTSSALDTVGFTGAPGGFFEGTPLTPVAAGGQRSYLRRFVAGVPTDTDNNAADFVAVDTAPAAGSTAVLGAPRPDGLTDPTVRNDYLQSLLLAGTDPAAEPNRIVTKLPRDNVTTLTINRRIRNCSGLAVIPECTHADPDAAPVTITRLRFRITGLSTVGSPGGGAILKAVSSVDLAGGIPVKGLTLDGPSVATGGGLNSTFTATADLPGGGLPSGQSIGVSFKFEVLRGGAFTFAFNSEDDFVAQDTPAGVTPVPTPAPMGAGSTETTPTPLPIGPAAVPASDVISGVVPGPAVMAVAPSVVAPAVAQSGAPVAAKALVCKDKTRVLIKQSKTKSGRTVPARCVTKTQAAAIRRAAAKQKAAAKQAAAKRKLAAKR